MAMRRSLLLALIAIASSALAADSTMSELAGGYSHRFRNGNVDGDVYFTTDIVEILPLDRNRAMLNMDLAFFNGHSCTLGGTATLEGNRLVYRENGPNSWSDGGCRLEIWRDRSHLRWAEGEGTSCQSHCGARGGLSTGKIPYRSRQKISADRAKLLKENPNGLFEH